MGKRRLLDAVYRPVKLLRAETGLRYLALLILLAFSTAGCSLPRIIVLDDPLTPEEHINLGLAYESRGETEAAIKEYKTASKNLPLAFLYLGNIHFGKGEFDEAESNYKKAIKKDPNNADAHNNLAWLYFTRRTNLDEAEALALRAIELGPRKADIYMDTLEKVRAARH